MTMMMPRLPRRDVRNGKKNYNRLRQLDRSYNVIRRTPFGRDLNGAQQSKRKCVERTFVIIAVLLTNFKWVVYFRYIHCLRNSFFFKQTKISIGFQTSECYKTQLISQPFPLSKMLSLNLKWKITRTPLI